MNAAAELLGEAGYAALTIERVAEHAGVARQTIYRRWRSKFELVVDLLARISESAPLPDTGTIRSDLIALYRRYASNIPTPGGPIVPALIAESLYNAELATIVRAYIMARRKNAIAIFERAIVRGEIRADAKPDVLVDLMSGFAWYRKLIIGLEMPEEDGEALVDALIAGIAES